MFNPLDPKMMQAMSKVPKLMALFEHIKEFSVKENEGKIVIDLTLSDKSKATVFVKLDIASKLQIDMQTKIKEMVSEK